MLDPQLLRNDLDDVARKLAVKGFQLDKFSSIKSSF
jgi:hypothetical protein